MAGSAGKIPVLGQGSKFSNGKLCTYVWVMRHCFSTSQIGIGPVAYVTTNMYLVWNLWSKYAAAWMGSALCVKQEGCCYQLPMSLIRLSLENIWCFITVFLMYLLAMRKKTLYKLMCWWYEYWWYEVRYDNVLQWCGRVFIQQCHFTCLVCL